MTPVLFTLGRCGAVLGLVWLALLLALLLAAPLLPLQPTPNPNPISSPTLIPIPNLTLAPTPYRD